VFRQIGYQLAELPGWNCCGASSAHSLNHLLGVALPARNLALAEMQGHDLVVPCAACFNRLKGAEHAMKNDPDLQGEIEALLGFEYSGSVAIRPVLGVLCEDFGPEQLRAQVQRPLNGLKLAAYYGCLLVRPPSVVQFDDPDNPIAMGSLLQSCGAEVVPWSHATDCCGGSLSLSRSDVVKDLVGRIVDRAREAGAEALATACPLCQVNLEMRQAAEPRMPVFYFTELLGLALGLPEAAKWWRKHLIDPRPALRAVGLA
jgi:heterodisulfide reductase subunit B